MDFNKDDHQVQFLRAPIGDGKIRLQFQLEPDAKGRVIGEKI